MNINIGDVFGRWEVTGTAYKKRYVVCTCKCGVTKEVADYSLTSGASQSCGCRSREITSQRTKTHGDSNTKFYKVYLSMLDRCLNPDSRPYKDYGGRGIGVSLDWQGDSGYLNFKRDMFTSYDLGMTLERINNNQDYSKDNCTWVSMKDQCRNRRKFKSNTSGYNGVHESVYGFRCYGVDETGKRWSKYFAKKLYGERALQMAIDYRRNVLEELRKRGVIYAEGHGL